MTNELSEIRRVRRLLKLSTTQLAHRLGTAQSTVSRLELSEQRGAITLSSLQRAAEALGCTLEYRFSSTTQADHQERDDSYVGLKRVRDGRSDRQGSLSKYMKEEEQKILATLTPEQRIQRACELSDLTRTLR